MAYFQPEIETAPREKIVALQNERLVKTVRRVYENVPFYREKMLAAGVTPDDIHSIADLHRLPFSYKKDLRDTYPFGLFTVPMKDVVRLHASSGTTGKQIVVGYTKNDMELWADCFARALTAAGATEEDIVHVSYGYGLFTGGLGADGGAMRIGATAVPVSTGNTQRQLTIMRDFGSIQSPQNAFLLNMGLESLHLRMAQHTANGLAVAQFLKDHPKISWVRYADLPGDESYELAQKYLPNGTCGVVSFGVAGGREAAERFMSALKLAQIATHVADARTCVLHPANATHRQMSDEELEAAGISPDLIRLSCGIESAEDLIADLTQALEAV